MDRPVTPSSAKQRIPASVRPVGVSHIERDNSGVASIIKYLRTVSLNRIWSSVNVKSMGLPSAWHAQHPLGNDVALDLVGPCVDGPGLREQEAVEPVADA